ncbi:hypothetical protein Poly51_01440 [Rubripirellula tenax]|uniref:Uncharacterized protein n=1 Tax=Rubripirellula tenax TaxID=2528015 RepID=A0A5C6FEG2_9BACT|nr:hypothetical protein Poly51_01440 [Rubripirellula tenax]
MLADWFDREIWSSRGLREYGEPVSPENLLADVPECIWPGLMGASLLPLMTNTFGDWICGRVSAENRIDTIIQWYHGGGDWIPWGHELSEAIVFDALQSRLPGKRRRHAIPASDFPHSVPPHEQSQQAHDRLLTWSLEHMPDQITRLLDAVNTPADEVASVLIESGVAEVAVRCELIQASLNLSLLSSLPAGSIGVHEDNAQQVSRWSLDHDTIPDNVRDLIESACGSPDCLSQDWQAAETHAVAVTQLAPDVAWGWDIAGYAAQRRADLSTAQSRYLSGAKCSVFSDQSIRLQTHWTSSQAGKFSAAMLAESFPQTVSDSIYLQAVCESDSIRRSDLVSRYWIEHAEAACRENDFSVALDYFHCAGWDLGMRPITAFAGLLDQIIDLAEKSGQRGRAAMATVHRRCLRDRYGD